MNMVTNKNNLQKSKLIKKEWKKPKLTTIKAAELADYIKVAALSTNCIGAFMSPIRII